MTDHSECRQLVRDLETRVDRQISDLKSDLKSDQKRIERTLANDIDQIRKDIDELNDAMTEQSVMFATMSTNIEWIRDKLMPNKHRSILIGGVSGIGGVGGLTVAWQYLQPFLTSS
jgi:septation ring formation regulator EzrA